MKHDMEKALNMKLIICIIEQFYGLKINFYKIEIVYFGKAKEMEEEYNILFGCESGALPFRYLDILIHFRKLQNGEWKLGEDSFEKKVE
jgi:hypothetical protein